MGWERGLRGPWLPAVILVIKICTVSGAAAADASPARAGNRFSHGGSSNGNPRITEHPEDDYFAKNEPATLNCKAEGNPPPVITWYRDGQLVETNRENPMSHRMLLDNGQLFFLRVIHTKNNRPDIGIYYCNATNIQGSAISRNATIRIAVLRDDFRQEPTDTSAAVGKSAVLHCRPPRGEPEPKVMWRKDGEIIQPNERIEIDDDGDLVISSVTRTDRGDYMCIAINKAGEKESSPARISVLDVPVFRKLPKDVTSEVGQTTEFHCDVGGDGPVNVQWKKEGGTIKLGRLRILPDNTLRIDQIEPSDEGVYICTAENAAGSTEAIGRLTVLYSPSFLIRPQDQTVARGRTVTLQCVATGNPPPTVFWSKESQESLMFPNRDRGRYSVAEDGTFRIEKVQKSDEGLYKCEALNTKGQASAAARVQVIAHDPRPPPVIKVGPQNQTLPMDITALLLCVAVGDPKPTVRWYKNGRPISLRDTRYAKLESGTLQISDLKVADTGTYTCKAVSETGETTWDAHLIVDPSFSGPAPRTPDISSLPGQPTKPVVRDITDTSVHLSWQPDHHYGDSQVSGFYVEYFGYETTDGWVIASSSVSRESYTVDGLLPNTTYVFLIRAKNAHGIGLPSQMSDPIRTLSHRGAVRNPRVNLPTADREQRLRGVVVEIRKGEAVNSSAIKISWTVLKAQDIIDGFFIRYKQILDVRRLKYGDTILRRVPYSQTTFTMTSLRSYSWYEVCVMAYSGGAESQCSSPMKVQTEEAVPSAAPESIAIHKVTDSQFRIQWAPPRQDSRNGRILGYQIKCQSENGRHNCSKVVNDTTFGMIIKKTLKGQRYSVQVAALTAKGRGQWSEAYIVGKKSIYISPDREGKGFDQSTKAEINEGPKQADLMKEPWFIGVLIGTIGGTLWLVLCIFTVWMCKKKKNKKKLKDQRYYTGVPTHKGDESAKNICYNTYGTKERNIHCPNDLGLPPEFTSLLHSKKDIDQNDDNLYNSSGDYTFPEMKTFYQKADPVAPYATTTLIQAQNIMKQRGLEHMFRPINQGYMQHSDGSGDSCQKREHRNSDSNTDNSCHMTNMPRDSSDHMQSPTSDSGSHSTDENGLLIKQRKKVSKPTLPGKQAMVNWAELLPPPPEHPPPNEMGDYQEGNPPPQYSEVRGDNRAVINRSPLSPVSFSQLSACSCPVPHSQTPIPGWNVPIYSDNECPRCNSEKYFDTRGYPPQQYIQRTSQSPRSHTLTHVPHSYVDTCPQSPCGTPASSQGYSQPPRGTPVNYSTPHRGTLSNRTSQSDQESHMPCFQAYRIVPTRENPYRFLNGSEWGPGPAPPTKHSSGDSGHGEEDDGPCMDRACQSSLPSLASECIYPPRYHIPQSERTESPVSEGGDYATESDLEQGTQQDGQGSTMGNWGNTDHSNTEESSNRSSTCSSADGSFLTEADFASAVAKAAEMSGLTVVGTTICDLNQKPKKERRHRRPARPVSPGYSTDSNYGSIDVVHKPYPKSNRKKQLMEQQNKRLRDMRESPSENTSDLLPWPSGAQDVPSYSRPLAPTSPTSANAPLKLSSLSPRQVHSPEGSVTGSIGNQCLSIANVDPSALREDIV